VINQIVIADCLDALMHLEPNTVDMTVFSPPYDAIRDYQDKPEFDLTGLGQELFRITKDGGICAMVMNDGTKDGAKSLTTFRTVVRWCDLIGWRLFETVIYARDGKPGAWWTKRFRVDHEYILLFLKGQRPAYFSKEHLKIPAKHAGKTWAGTQRLTDGSLIEIEKTLQGPMKCRGTIWKYKTSNTEGNKLKMQHPATMPDQLAEDLIRTFTKMGDLVLDPMCGSGTTLVAAKKSGRNYLGIDISQDYCEIAKRRLTNE